MGGPAAASQITVRPGGAEGLSRYRTIVWLLIIIVVTCGPYFILHPVDAMKFLLINFREPGPASAGNFGFQGIVSKIFCPGGLDDGGVGRLVAQYISMAVIIIIGLWATIRARKERFAECLCLWVVAYFMVYIDVWEHQYVMLLPVIVFLYLKRPGIIPWLIWFVFACPTTYKYFYDILYTSIQAGAPVDLIKDASFWNDWHFTLIKPLGLVALYVYCIWFTVRRGNEQPTK